MALSIIRVTASSSASMAFPMTRFILTSVFLAAVSLAACDKGGGAGSSASATKESGSSSPKSTEKPKAGGPTSEAPKAEAINRDLTKGYGGDEAGAKALVSAFLDPKTDRTALTKALQPDSADYRAIFEGAAAAKAEESYKKLWNAPDFDGIGGHEDQTEVLLWAIPTEDIIAWSEKAKELPGGYERVKDKFKKGLVIYRFKFVKPGSKLGTANDGLVFVNGHWAFVPKPWKAIGGD